MRRATRDGRSLSCTRQRERNIDLTRVPARERSRAGMGGALGVIVSSRRDAQRRQKAVGRRLGDPRHQRRAPRQRHLSHSAVPAQGSGPDGRALTPWFTRKKNGAALALLLADPREQGACGASGLPRLPAAELIVTHFLARARQKAFWPESRMFATRRRYGGKIAPASAATDTPRPAAP